MKRLLFWGGLLLIGIAECVWLEQAAAASAEERYRLQRAAMARQLANPATPLPKNWVLTPIDPTTEGMVCVERDCMPVDWVRAQIQAAQR